MNNAWTHGSLLERMALRWKGLRTTCHEQVDIFGELRRAQKVLLIPNDRVGGLFLGAGIYKSVRPHYPSAQVTLLTDERWATLARWSTRAAPATIRCSPRCASP